MTTINQVLKALYNAADNLSILFSYSYTDKEDGSPNAVNTYKSVANANNLSNPSVDPGHPNGTPIDISSERGRISADAPLGLKQKGNDLLRTPNLTTNIRINYERQLGEGMAAVNASYYT